MIFDVVRVAESGRCETICRNINEFRDIIIDLYTLSYGAIY